jgi:hypothetical protein
MIIVLQLMKEMITMPVFLNFKNAIACLIGSRPANRSFMGFSS